MMRPSVEVRRATAADAPRIAAVHVRGWQDGYRDLLTADLLAGLDIDERAAVWEQRLAADEPPLILVAIVDDAVAGFVSAGPSRDEPGHSEIYALYVDPARWRGGVGAALLDAALTALPPSPVHLWVLADNARGRAFYASQGFEPDGRTKVQERQGARLAEVRYLLCAFGDHQS